ncbi:MAG: 2OG-Fe(II) oxygenase [Betaproteobacteria bacterium]
MSPIENTVPYQFFHFHKLCTKAESTSLLKWLEGLDDWKRVRTTFYDQFERSVSTNDSFHIQFRSLKNKLLSRLTPVIPDRRRRLSENVDIGIIKLCAGQGIGVHTDFRAHNRDQEAYRLIAHICSEDLEGGHLLLLSSARLQDEVTIIEPRSGSGVAFPVSRQSFHAVGEVIKGVRYSLVLKVYFEDQLENNVG